ncbi:uncharacterized protein GIQ15_03837 [Arthroderma uncinatum]|uniref:uncharacterized protein n=1 Tax=Arthroderma uncinatum TaxID=74035 RepID=UPI00144A7492|nr:uncharacterized protein GIQ15_03837 [Arthroderma uncinatum]KAF3481078.1 hypothetical protein GIQ15_03837 [Arthroderma uncinatum]
MSQPRASNPFKREASIPLSLETHWFVGDKPKFPYPALRKLGTILNADYRWESADSVALDGSIDHTFIGAVRWEDQESDTHADSGVVTKIRVTWNSNDVNGSMRGEVKNIYHDRERGGYANGKGNEITAQNLRLASDWYGRYIVGYCMDRIGLSVGDGECWTLAYRALEEAGKRSLREDSREPPMLSVGRVHGHLIFEWHATPDYPIDIASGILQHMPAVPIEPGDIMELAEGRFQKVNFVLSGLVKQEENVRFKAHTAVVNGVEGCTIKVVEQNGRIKSVVAENGYDLGSMVDGTVRIYRPVGISLSAARHLHRGVSASLSLSGVCDSW